MGRIVAFNFVGYEDADGAIAYANRGQEVDFPPEAEKRLDDLGALVPEGASLPEFEEGKLDAYRAPRGDALAARKLAEAAEQGRQSVGIVDLSQSGEGVAARIREGGLNAEETVALAEGDPEKAKEILAAEREATGGSPRKTVEEPLQKIIDGA